MAIRSYQYTTISIMPHTKKRFLRIISPILKIFKGNIWEDSISKLCEWIETTNQMIERLHILKDKGILKDLKESLTDEEDKKAIGEIEKALEEVSKIRVSEEE